MRSPTPWIAALLVSVLVNGALFGFLLHRSADGPSWRGHHRDGPMMDGGPPQRQSPMGPGFDMRAFLAALPAEEREQAGRRFRAEMESMRGVWGEMIAARARADAALAAEPFDADAVRAALGEVREIHLRIEDRLEASIIEALAALDPDVRAAALAAGRESHRGGRRGPSGRDRGPRGDGEWRGGERRDRPDGDPGPPPPPGENGQDG